MVVFDAILSRLRSDAAPASQAEMEAGSEADVRAMSPLAVAQAIAALSPTVGEGKPAGAKTAPVDADDFQLWDSAAAGAGKTLSWASVKTALALLFAGLTHAAEHATDGDDPLAPADIGAATAAQGLLADTALQDATAFEAAGAVSGHAALSDAVHGLVKNNMAALTAPGVGDDTVDGYAVGSVWIDTVGQAAYICLDATEGSAVWALMATAGS